MGGSEHTRITGCLFAFENPVFRVPLESDNSIVGHYKDSSNWHCCGKTSFVGILGYTM